MVSKRSGNPERKAEKKRVRDIERKRKQAVAMGLDPDAKQRDQEQPSPPPLEEESPEEFKNTIKLAGAIYEACIELEESKCTVSMLGSHFKVHPHKKGDERLSKFRLVELIKRHTDLFEVTPEGEQSAQWPVKLVDGAREKLIEHQKKCELPTVDDEEAKDDSGLPDVGTPKNQREAIQMVRIATARALYRRGSTAMLHDICQDRTLHKLKTYFNGEKLVESVMLSFPENFEVEDKGNGHRECNLLSMDMEEGASMDAAISKTSKQMPPYIGPGAKWTKGSGRGKGSADAMWNMMMLTMMKGKAKGWGKGKF
eukprot:TRINITY_DN15846_c0_g1_i1.p1 TRINITY_DN15846_c0_g1~~TRINITY_DN15846_c0_g1_i1.p1  ORF type:complete len:312 (-),score=100.84 TRINITY_DN15846_c0_g1_i1:262-1197(-)